MLDVLESRVFLTVSLSNGVLLIDGTGGTSRITTAVSAGMLIVNQNGQESSWAIGEVSSVLAQLGGGDDYASLSAVLVPVTAEGGAGNDTLIGGGGNDTIRGGNGDDSIQGGRGDDQLYGGDGRDIQRGGWGNDTLRGAMGNDTSYGGEGNDLLVGGADDDWLEGAAGNDTIQGGTGIDLVNYSARTANLYITLDGSGASGESGEYDRIGTDIENATGGYGDDLIRGNAADNDLRASSGNDTLSGLEGNDTLRGAGGEDWLMADPGSDEIHGGIGVDTANYSFRTEDLVIRLDGLANDGAAGENDNVMTDVENVRGGYGNDLLAGSDAANTFLAGAGDDTIDGGWGNDTLWGGDGFDTADYSSRTMLQQLRINEGSGVPGEQDIPHDDVECLIGGSGDDWIQGGDNNNLLIGGAGHDTLIGMGGNDTLIGDAGADLLGHDSSGPRPAMGDAGDDVYYTSVVGSNDDGSVDRLTDETGTNVLNYSTTDADQVLTNWPGDLALL